MLLSKPFRLILIGFFSALLSTLSAQSILPPIQEWHGKSESLIAKSNHPWITPTEKSDFKTTPSYDETMAWFKKLADASPLIRMVSIGRSPEGRDLCMVIASTDKSVTASALKNSSKPLLLVQAGIHAGEIDGKDAGMMLLRDIAFGSKKHLVDKVNFLFIPILNVDGHERTSAFNRPNQRGPENMGYRTNAQNLNLNRDYAKIDTKEIRAVIKVINEYNPTLYMDIHVTDGADYQYDITFGGFGKQGYSPAISNWLLNEYKVSADKELSASGHIPGQLIFAVNDVDFSQGTTLTIGEPRFSEGYGNLRHLPAILVENHSLKPFKQRVLGTYVLLESTLQILAYKGISLQQSIAKDKTLRADKIPLSWKIPQMKDSKSSDASAVAPDSLEFLGIESKRIKSAITNTDYVQWTGKPTTLKIANYKATEAAHFISRPKAYYVPASCFEVIERLKLHGIQMEIIKEAQEVEVEMYRITDYTFGDVNHKVQPYEGHMQVTAKVEAEKHQQVFPKGSVYITTDQPLGELVVFLLEPQSRDSYFSWGFFNPIFQRTEYIEPYVMEPTMTKMLEDNAVLKAEFELKKVQDTQFATDPNAIYNWFYSKTKYYDSRYLLYPIGRKL